MGLEEANKKSPPFLFPSKSGIPIPFPSIAFCWARFLAFGSIGLDQSGLGIFEHPLNIKEKQKIIRSDLIVL